MDFTHPERCRTQRTGREDRRSKFYEISDNLLAQALEPYRQQGIGFHAIRTRQAGRRAFISLHVVVPGEWTVREGHGLLDRLERDIRAPFRMPSWRPIWNPRTSGLGRITRSA